MLQTGPTLIHYVDGNLLDMAEAGEFDVIAHGCNAMQCMGGGIALQIADRFPGAFEADVGGSLIADPLKMGSYTWCNIYRPDRSFFSIYNLYTQFNRGGAISSEERAARLSWIYWSIKHLLTCLNTDTRIGIPMIGAGLAGGDWDKISAAICRACEEAGRSLTVVRYKP